MITNLRGFMMAQVPTPPAGDIEHWLVSFAAVMAIVALAITLKRMVFGDKTHSVISPQPLEVRAAHEFVRKEECIARHMESVRSAVDLKEQLSELRTERKDDTEKLHEKVNNVALQVAGLKAASDMQTQSLASMDAKLNRIVEKGLKSL